MLKNNFVATIEASIKAHWELNALSNYQGKTYTYGQMAGQIYRLHQVFRLADISPGDKVVVTGKNQANWGIVYLATVTYGAVIVPLLVDFKPKDIVDLTKHSDALVLFACENTLKKIDTEELKYLKAIFTLDDFQPVHTNGVDKANLEQIIESGLPENFSPENFSLATVANDTLLGILYTSGTSGFSKGVMLNHNAIMANVEFGLHNIPLKKGATVVSFLPMAHAYGCAFEFLYPVAIGGHITVLGKTPSPQVILKAFADVRPELVLMVPLVLEKIYKNKLKPELEKPLIQVLQKIPLLNQLVFKKFRKELEIAFGGNFYEIIIGGAALNPEVETFLRKIKFRYTVGYGMTECGPLISYAPHTETRMGSTGKAIHTLQAKIDKTAPDATDGEILVKGHNVLLGYYKNEEATRQVLGKDGWLHTGDLGHIDSDGYIYIRGRNKSLILDASGKNIYPEEIEARFNNLTLVTESLAVHRNDKIVILLYLDEVKTRHLKNEEIDNQIRADIKHINAEMPSYYAVKDFELRKDEFEKTAKRSIKRFLYQ